MTLRICATCGGVLPHATSGCVAHLGLRLRQVEQDLAAARECISERAGNWYGEEVLLVLLGEGAPVTGKVTGEGALGLSIRRLPEKGKPGVEFWPWSSILYVRREDTP